MNTNSVLQIFIHFPCLFVSLNKLDKEVYTYVWRINMAIAELDMSSRQEEDGIKRRQERCPVPPHLFSFPDRTHVVAAVHRFFTHQEFKNKDFAEILKRAISKDAKKAREHGITELSQEVTLPQINPDTDEVDIAVLGQARIAVHPDRVEMRSILQGKTIFIRALHADADSVYQQIIMEEIGPKEKNMVRQEANGTISFPKKIDFGTVKQADNFRRTQKPY